MSTTCYSRWSVILAVAGECVDIADEATQTHRIAESFLWYNFYQQQTQPTNAANEANVAHALLQGAATWRI